MRKLNSDLGRMALSRMLATGIILASVVLAGSVVTAQQGPGGGKRGAPPEALEACEGKSVEDACSMTLRDRNETVSGQCVATPDEKIACMPEGAPRPPKS